MEEKILQFKSDLEQFAKTKSEISLYAVARCVGAESIPIYELRKIIDDFLFHHPDFEFVLQPVKKRVVFTKLLGEGYLKRKTPKKDTI